MPRRRLGLLAGVLTLLTVAGLGFAGALPALSADRTPTLRLVRGPRHVNLVRWPGEPTAMDVGVHVAAVDGAFEIRARKTRDGYSVTQVRSHRNGDVDVLRRLPANTVRDLSQGLRGFFAITVTDRSGRTVATRKAPLCLGGWERARVDDTGPVTSRYPGGCYTSRLGRAAVWGIDQGWAAPALQGVPLTVEDGTYRIDMKVTPRYIRLLDMDPRTSTASARVTITTEKFQEPCEGPEPCEPGEPGEPGPLPPSTPALAPESHGHSDDGAPTLLASADGLPDLVALPAHAVTARYDEETSRDVVDFAATVWNAGPGPLVVEGFRRPGAGLMDAYQYLYADGRRLGKHDAGSLEFDRRDGHDHWHFTDFARYRLLDGDKKAVVRSRKEAFCLAPTDAIDLTLRGANWQPGATGLTTACGGPNAIWIREILDVGWGDTYHQSLPGQSFDITDLDNGIYYVEVTTNPVGNLRERTRNNNTAYRRVRIEGVPGERIVTGLGAS